MSFIHSRKIWYGISLVLLIAGLISFGFQGLNKGIDFTAGNVLQLQFQDTISTEEITGVLEAEGHAGFTIQAGGNPGEFIIRTKELTEDENKQLLFAFEKEYGSYEVKLNQKIGEVIGKELTRNAVLALAIAAVLMVAYISFRFEATFGIAAVVALLHDVLITVGLFSIFQFEVDSAFVAALLTIIGYSINNTIVIFDRIRENLNLKQKEALDITVDNSVKQTLFRSISTSLTVIFALVALLVLGGDTTKIFALALLIGTVVGTYSSICIATSLWYDIKNKVNLGKKAKYANPR